MKKLLTLLSTLAFAGTLCVPVFAQVKSPKPAKSQQTSAAKTTTGGKLHRKHSKKHGTKAAKKMDQKSMTSDKATK